MKHLSTFLFLLFAAVAARGQQVILSEDFNSNIPGAWTQNTTLTGVNWQHSSNLGAGGGGCARVSNAGAPGTGSVWLQMAPVNLTPYSSATIYFKVASVMENTAAPNLSLWYAANGGNWQQLANWGASGTNFTIPTSTKASPPLTAADYTWAAASFSLNTLLSNANIRFAIGGDFAGSGYALLDSVRITGTGGGSGNTVYTLPYTQDFEGSTFLPTDWERFGGNTNADWQRTTATGGFGNSSACAYFDNFTTNLNNNFYGMRAVWLDLTGSTKPMLSFDYAYAKRTGSQSDLMGIWYMEPTTSWTNLATYSDATLTTAPDQATAFTPTATQWQTKKIDLSAFKSSDEIRFAFECNSRNGNMLYIDNVQFYDEAKVGIAGP